MAIKRPIQCEDTGEVANTYKEYLRTGHWKVLRMRKIKEIGFTCEICGRTGVPLQVHHLTYVRLGNEMMSDLACICGICHSTIHSLHSTGWEYKLLDVRKKRKLEKKNMKQKSENNYRKSRKKH